MLDPQKDLKSYCEAELVEAEAEQPASFSVIGKAGGIYHRLSVDFRGQGEAVENIGIHRDDVLAVQFLGGYPPVLLAFDRDDEGTLQAAFEPREMPDERRAVAMPRLVAHSHVGVIAWWPSGQRRPRRIRPS